MERTETLFTKLVILNTAKKLFVEKGYFNTSIRDIAKEADLSTGAVYHHFGSKEEIASVIYRETLDRIKDLIQSAIREGGTTKERIRNLVKKLFYMAEKDRYTMEYALYIKHREIIDTPNIWTAVRHYLLRNTIFNTPSN